MRFEVGDRVRTIVSVAYRNHPKQRTHLIPKGSVGVIQQQHPGEDAYEVLIERTYDANDTDFLYDYELEVL